MADLDVIWGVNPNRLLLNKLKNGQTVFIPKSRCSEPCDMGAVKVVKVIRTVQCLASSLLQKMTEGETCCWVCTTCRAYEFVADEFTCLDCGVGR